MAASNSLHHQLGFLFVRIYYWFYIKYMQWSQWVFQPTGKAYQKFEQKLVIFGDDHALGLGDKMSLGGLPGLADRLSFKLRNDQHIRQFWHVFNFGKFKANTEDWLPSSSTTIAGHKNYFDNILVNDKRLEGFKLAVLLLGSNDEKLARLNPQKSLENIKTIVNKLNEMDVTVIVMTVPTTDPTEDEGQSYNDRLNAQLKAYIEEEKNPKLILGVEIDALNFEYDRVDLYHWDRLHFNEKGFDKMFKDLWDIVKPEMVKVEFKTFQNVLYKN
ncbi:SGNH hydrolase [Conidiobolus coronatus NRRL 28638]|uniref:SGNH hydrolase n=1 Tax=Conidiobolus coronatus (strain ATCC 28846 / CBS 209.66 / NRRL 28638) TaxID=796925 RepID=A0A137P165_CONC2|nr:SGNH hydrolase [Conidiobolus coronatus NRRL 28638]|eukprot:KXN68810.1 SGNH hydrolase [Conidiobolus coronatus NRRL 28638]